MNPAGPYFLTTARIGFRHWQNEDLPLAQSLWGDPVVTRLIGGPFSPQQVQKRLVQEIASQAAHQMQYWPMFFREDGQFLGSGGLRPYRIEQHVYELGIHLRPAYWGQGFAKEAGRAVIAFAFDRLGAAELFAGHHPANTASKRLLEKLDFRFTHEELYAPTGLMHPSYSLHRAERNDLGS